MTDPRGICRAAPAIAAVVLLCGCASRGTAARNAAGGGSLETYMGQVRALSAVARPESGDLSQHLESWDPALAQALRAAAVDPTAERERTVAQQYRRLGVLDMAYDHLSRAIRLDPANAEAYAGRARIWRDWGFAALGLPDAYKATDLAPDSPDVANTVGTLLAATGNFSAARSWYARALLLDPDAGYALNNICYADLMLRHMDAITACRRAAEAAPTLGAANNNLGLAYAAEDDFASARRAFAAGASAPGVADYNLGIAYMARRQFKKATEAFAAARRANPDLRDALVREQQARAKIAPEGFK